MVHFNDLPVEVISHIVQYLDIEDIKSVQLTSHKLFYICEKEFHSKTILKFILNNQIPMFFFGSLRKFSNVHIRYGIKLLNEDVIKQLFSLQIIKNVKNLTLENFGDFISFERFCEILKVLTKLQQLNCISTSFSKFKNKSVENNEEEVIQNSEYVSKIISSDLESLSISSMNEIKIFSNVKNLKKLSFDVYDCDDSTIFYHRIIENNKNSLKSLSVKTISPLFKEILYLSNLQLQEFIMNGTEDNPVFFEFLKKQNSLTSLGLLTFLSSQCFADVLKNFPMLKSLNFQDSDIQNSTVKEILKLKNLKSLNVNFVISSGTEIVKGLIQNINYNITELLCEIVSLSDDDFVKLTKNLPNLESFHCTANSKKSAKIIFQNCKNLVNLSIYGTESNLGVPIPSNTNINSEMKGYEEWELNKLKSFTLNKIKFDEEMLKKVKFNNLKKIVLNRCLGDQLFEIDILVKNCPKIQEFVLYTNFDAYDTIFNKFELIINNLQKLKRLKIESIGPHSYSKNIFAGPADEPIFVTVLIRLDYIFCDTVICCDCNKCIKSIEKTNKLLSFKWNKIYSIE